MDVRMNYNDPWFAVAAGLTAAMAMGCFAIAWALESIVLGIFAIVVMMIAILTAMRRRIVPTVFAHKVAHALHLD
jgi:hypothetical protein